jgi:hypothetical protein
LGRLLNAVRERAVSVIDSGQDLRRWRRDNTPSEVKQREKHLARLREQLLGPQPKPKKLKPPKKSSTDFSPGDVASFRLDDKTAVRFCVLHVWSDRGGRYANLCLLGLDNGRPFRRRKLTLRDTLGPQYTMVSHEPAERITYLARGLALPPRDATTFRAWNNLAVDGHACTWDDFPDAVRGILPKLGWS